jgi:hypothetical protein
MSEEEKIVEKIATFAQGCFQHHPVVILGSGAVIPPFLAGFGRRIYAAAFSFWAGVIPPMPMFGRSLL